MRKIVYTAKLVILKTRARILPGLHRREVKVLIIQICSVTAEVSDQPMSDQPMPDQPSPLIIARFSEITLKGRNRSFFEKRMERNAALHLRAHGPWRIKRERARRNGRRPAALPTSNWPTRRQRAPT